MDFRMTVVPPSGDTPLEPEFETGDDYGSLVMDICQLLARTDCRFHVGGFGQDPWPVDVSYDLSSVVEQLPEALLALRRREPARVDLYGQGVERLVTFAPQDDFVVLKCAAYSGGWIASPDTEVVPYDEAVGILVACAEDFRAAMERVVPGLAALEPFSGW